ncbi:MAPEG family protein [Pannonibacter phragmitetus]|uniref:MAPEG family protein n=1 Tax=Pannonibacter phragmitetus TaxID=121719 RepID=UPI003D2F0F74
MPIAFWCVLAAAFLPILSVVPAKLTKDFSNARPRDPAFWAEGFRARAQGAQANGFEAFPLFAVAVLVAYQQGAIPSGLMFWQRPSSGFAGFMSCATGPTRQPCARSYGLRQPPVPSRFSPALSGAEGRTKTHATGKLPGF